MIKRMAVAGGVLIGAAALGVHTFRTVTVPTVRDDVANPIYTIGERATYSAALNSGADVLKFGPMVFGLYPGGMAFASAQDARDYLREHGWSPDRWSVYKLSGDFVRDSTKGHITSSMLVIEEAR